MTALSIAFYESCLSTRGEDWQGGGGRWGGWGVGATKEMRNRALLTTPSAPCFVGRWLLAAFIRMTDLPWGGGGERGDRETPPHIPLYIFTTTTVTECPPKNLQILLLLSVLGYCTVYNKEPKQKYNNTKRVQCRSVRCAGLLLCRPEFESWIWHPKEVPPTEPASAMGFGECL
jgi:hypothetical protein